MQVFQTNFFKKSVKKLYLDQKAQLDKAISIILADPLRGIEKRGDLAGIRVYKFNMTNQLMLLAYKYDRVSFSILLLALGPHENFYRDLKKI